MKSQGLSPSAIEDEGDILSASIKTRSTKPFYYLAADPLKAAAWQKELADELDFQRSMRLPVDPPRPKELVLHGDYSS